jgi:hypothetical protein
MSLSEHRAFVCNGLVLGSRQFSLPEKIILNSKVVKIDFKSSQFSNLNP